MAGGDKANFAQELLKALRTGQLARNPDFSEEINDFAQSVKERLDEINHLLDHRGLHHYEAAIDFVEDLKKKLEDAMEERRNARVGGVVGNLARIAGTVFYAHPVGQAVFWGGLAVSGISDHIAKGKSEEVQRFVTQINRVLERDEESFRRLSRVVQRLDNAIEQRTGWSLYSEEFRAFLREAAQNPQRVQNLPVCRNADQEQRENLLTLARNGNAIRVLTEVAERMFSGDISYISIVYHLVESIGVVQSSVEIGAALQTVEVVLRGVEIFNEYRQDRRTLEDVGRGVGRMRKELQTLRQIFPDV